MNHLREMLFVREAAGSPGGDSAPPATSCTPEAEAAAAAAAFAAYDRYRRGRLAAQIGERGREALQLLPLLLHVNEPGLPGYVDDPLCPAGIADFSPHSDDLRLARRLFPEARLRRSGVLRPVVELVAVMGSAGTIGFSGESDLDVWVCHDPGTSDALLTVYRRKVLSVEAWLNRHAGLEVHLFFQAASRIRADDFGETGVEGCGSALGALLKEEFYRTGILLAGKAPAWRLVPPLADPDAYRRHWDALRATPGFPAGEYVDLGGVARVPPGELFGAAVWQIVKGWKSPFKSALKLGLLEYAVSSGREAPPLCEQLKQRVLAGERVDPYRLLFDQVLAHYRALGESGSEDLLARCFYLKTGIRLEAESGPRRRASGGSDEAVLAEYAAAWGWGARRLQHLNGFSAWKFEWVQALAREVDRYFLRTYQRIRETLEAEGEVQRITPRDLTVLGRKLQAVYRRAPHKVETLHLVTQGVEEPSVSLYQEVLPDGEAPWRLFRGRVTPLTVDGREGDLLRVSNDPLELLVWAAQNHILGARTRVFCHGLAGELPAADLEALAQGLTAFVERAQGREPTHEDLLGDAVPTAFLAVPNLLEEAEEVRDLGAVHATTWGETFYRRWEGPDAFRGFVEEALVAFLLESPAPDRLEIFAPPRKVGVLRGCHRRLQRELGAAAAFVGGASFAAHLRRRFVGASEAGTYVLDRTAPAELRYRAFKDREDLLRFLCAVGPHARVETRVESLSPELAPLRAVCESSLPGGIDVFVLEEAAQETLFVADEVGNLARFTSLREDAPYALARLLVFLEGVVPELATQEESPLHGRALGDVLRIHTLVREGTCRAVCATHEHLARVRALGLRPVGLTIERTSGRSGGAGGYRITWGMQTIESGEVENPLAEARRRIREARRSGLDYGVFVTRLFLDERFIAEHCGRFVTTGHYLFYKRAIEQRLAG
ncbi:MAG: class I adenylate cyclase [Thermodesulfobacteriota bacterium]